MLIVAVAFLVAALASLGVAETPPVMSVQWTKSAPMYPHTQLWQFVLPSRDGQSMFAIGVDYSAARVGGSIHKLDAHTGKTIWNVSTSALNCFLYGYTPQLYLSDCGAGEEGGGDADVLGVFCEGHRPFQLFGLSQRTGELRWNVPIPQIPTSKQGVEVGYTVEQAPSPNQNTLYLFNQTVNHTWLVQFDMCQGETVYAKTIPIPTPFYDQFVSVTMQPTKIGVLFSMTGLYGLHWNLTMINGSTAQVIWTKNIYSKKGFLGGPEFIRDDTIFAMVPPSETLNSVAFYDALTGRYMYGIDGTGEWSGSLSNLINVGDGVFVCSYTGAIYPAYDLSALNASGSVKTGQASPPVWGYTCPCTSDYWGVLKQSGVFFYNYNSGMNSAQLTVTAISSGRVVAALEDDANIMPASPLVPTDPGKTGTAPAPTGKLWMLQLGNHTTGSVYAGVLDLSSGKVHSNTSLEFFPNEGEQTPQIVGVNEKVAVFISGDGFTMRGVQLHI